MKLEIETYHRHPKAYRGSRMKTYNDRKATKTAGRK
jgi:hypothetical protein